MPKTPKYSLTDEPVNCGHCGRELLMFIICGNTYDHSNEYKLGGEEDFYIHCSDTYSVLICPACHAATVMLEHRNSEYGYEILDASGELITVQGVQETTLYPTKTRSFQYAPTDVMDYVTEQYPPKFIRAMLSLTDEQMESALSYIHTHRTELRQNTKSFLRKPKNCGNIMKSKIAIALLTLPRNLQNQEQK